jgi:predicted RNA-binding Zn-ribbon protein involved in translation (DUF1610 family)
MQGGTIVPATGKDFPSWPGGVNQCTSCKLVLVVGMVLVRMYCPFSTIGERTVVNLREIRGTGN